MSFKLFIYYCAICDGWAALLAWGLIEWLKVPEIGSPSLRSGLMGGIVGLLLAGVMGTLDAAFNATGPERIIRVLVCLGVGLGGGALGGVLGSQFHRLLMLGFLGWMMVGMMIGLSSGVFDVARALSNRQVLGIARRKMISGIIGGVLGGLVGGLMVDILRFESVRNALKLPRGSEAIGLVLLGVSIGLLIGLAQVVFKEAWITVEKGFRSGRELMLSKADTTIGRAESCDVGLFGDPILDRVHARITLRGTRYVLEDAGSSGGTFLNDQPVTQAVPLHSGDTIRVGNSILRFGERQRS